MWDGQVARTYYSSSSGGRTEAVQDAWPGSAPIPYLRSVPDPYDTYSPHHDWGPFQMSAATLAGRLGLGSPVDSARVEQDGSARALVGRVPARVGRGREPQRRPGGEGAAPPLDLVLDRLAEPLDEQHPRALRRGDPRRRAHGEREGRAAPATQRERRLADATAGSGRRHGVLAPAAQVHRLQARAAEHERDVGCGRGRPAGAGAGAGPEAPRRRGLAAPGRGGRGLAARARPVARRRAPDPRRPRRVQDAAAAPRRSTTRSRSPATAGSPPRTRGCT